MVSGTSKFVENFGSRHWSDITIVSATKALGEIAARDPHYTRFLDMFVSDYEWRLEEKRKDKATFLLWTRRSAIVLGLVLIGAILYTVICSPVTAILITLVAGVLAEFIAIPLVIAQYLFNPKEDENMHNLIKTMQDHDASGRKLLLEIDSGKEYKHDETEKPNR